MTRYIDADKILSHLNDEIEGCGDCDVYSQPVVYGTRLGLEYSKSLVETAEIADVQEVRHGRWNTINSKVTQCSVCGVSRDIRTQVGWNFCPVCGAKMDAEEQE